MRGRMPQGASFFAGLRAECRLMHSPRRLHGSCVSRNGDAILLVGPPGSGKSDLALRLLSRGFDLVADDQVEVTDGVAYCPPPLAGLLEARGVGIVRLPHQPSARIAVIIDLAAPAERLPQPRLDPALGVPVIGLDARHPSAVDKAALALDCALGRVTQIAGAFAP